jgi:hypothetical protein
MTKLKPNESAERTAQGDELMLSGDLPQDALKRCPFCGATPHRGQVKPMYDQMHGELLHNYRVWCPHGCASIRKQDEKFAIAAWNTRSASALEITKADIMARAETAVWFKEHPHASEATDIDQIALNAALAIEQLNWGHPTQRTAGIQKVIADALRASGASPSKAPSGPAGDAGQVGWLGGDFDR